MTDGLESRYSKTRRYKRRDLAGRVAVVHEGRILFEEASQISEGGMLLRCQRSIAVGSPIELRFFLPPGIFLSLKAEIAYVFEPSPGRVMVGMRFIDIDPAARESIADFVKK